MPGGPKRTPTEREADLAETAKLDRRGWSQRDIAAVLGVSHQQVGLDLKTIRRQYAETKLHERGEAVAEKIQQYRDIRQEAWLAWNRSKENKKKRIKEKVTEGGSDPGQQAERLKAIIITEGRLPENAYLQTVLKTLEDEAELLDLYPVKKLQHAGPEGGPIQLEVKETVVRTRAEASQVLSALAETSAIPGRD